ncbi:MAG: hypothetical protein ACREOO_01920 [bacterium]
MKPEGNVSVPGAPIQIRTLPLDPDLLAEILPGAKEIKLQGEHQLEGSIAAQSGRKSNPNSPCSISNCNFPRPISLSTWNLLSVFVAAETAPLTGGKA